MAAAPGRTQRRQLVVCQEDFLPGVEIEIPGHGLDPWLGPIRGAIEQVVGGDQRAVHGVAQVRQINAAERSVPVAAIALSAIQLGAGRFDQAAILALLLGLAHAAADHQHPRVHLVGLGILHLEVPPEAAAHELREHGPARIVLQLVLDPFVLQ